MLPVTFIHAKSESGDDYYFATPGALTTAQAQTWVDDYLVEHGSDDAGSVYAEHTMVYG